MKVKNVTLKHGLIKFNRIQFCWDLNEWSLPLSIYYDGIIIEFRFLCLMIMFRKGFTRM